jgi:hypothetical protein
MQTALPVMILFLINWQDKLINMLEAEGIICSSHTVLCHGKSGGGEETSREEPKIKHNITVSYL